MMHSLSKLGALSAVTTVLLAACAHADRNDPAVPGTVPRRFVDVGVMNAQPNEAIAGIVENLSAARCHREEACDNVGAGRQYDSLGVCLNAMRGSIGNDLNADNCPMGIDRANLERCRLAIQQEHCGDALASIGRADACRKAALCVQ